LVQAVLAALLVGLVVMEAKAYSGRLFLLAAGLGITVALLSDSDRVLVVEVHTMARERTGRTIEAATTPVMVPVAVAGLEGSVKYLLAIMVATAGLVLLHLSQVLLLLAVVAVGVVLMFLYLPGERQLLVVVMVALNLMGLMPRLTQVVVAVEPLGQPPLSLEETAAQV
jgi:hypothetical protein